MGKWTNLRGKFPLRVPGEQAYLEKVDNERALRASVSLADLMVEFEQLNAEKDEHEDVVKGINVKLEALQQLMISRFDELGVTSMRTVSGRTLYQQIEPEPSVAEPQKLEKYIEDNPDLEYLYKVNHQSLKSLVKGMLEEGKDTEVETMGVSVFLREKIGSRKS